MRLGAQTLARVIWETDDLDDHDVVLAMSIVRAARWRVEALVDCSVWRVVYEGPDMRSAIHAVQDHDEVQVKYLYGTWREIS